MPVGAVVLGPDGAELATAHNEREATGDPTAHAEILALRRAAEAHGEWRLTDCTLVVTLEPCTMCAGAPGPVPGGPGRLRRPRREGGAAGSLWDVVRDRRLNHRPEVIAGRPGAGVRRPADVLLPRPLTPPDPATGNRFLSRPEMV